MCPSLFCLPCLANPPTRANVLMPSSSQSLINCASSLYPQLRDQLHLWAFPEVLADLYLQCDGFAPSPKQEEENLGVIKRYVWPSLLYTLPHLYCLSMPEDFESLLVKNNIYKKKIKLGKGWSQFSLDQKNQHWILKWSDQELLNGGERHLCFILFLCQLTGSCWIT